jgi:hypothetical protein
MLPRSSREVERATLRTLYPRWLRRADPELAALVDGTTALDVATPHELTEVAKHIVRLNRRRRRERLRSRRPSLIRVNARPTQRRPRARRRRRSAPRRAAARVGPSTDGPPATDPARSARGAS